MSNSRNTHRQSWITTYRVVSLVLLVALAVIGSVLLTRPAPHVSSATEIAEAINGPAKFQRPSAMEYVAKTGSCVVGGTVMSTQWHVGRDTFAVTDVESKSVDSTSFDFKSATGREFRVSVKGALYTGPGENLGLELDCDPATMNSAASFGMIAIIYGGS